MTQQTIWVLMLTHNRSAALHQALNMPAFQRGITRAQDAGYSVFLFIQAQACTDDTWDWLKVAQEWLPCDVVAHEIEFNLWAIGGRHRQIDWLLKNADLQPDDVVIFLDDDIRIVSSDWIEMFTNGLADDTVGACGLDGKTFLEGWAGSQQVRADDLPNADVDVVGGGWMAVKSAVLLSGINYDLAQMPFWGGDDDFCLQIRAGGWRVISLGLPDVSGLCHDPAHGAGDERFWESQRRLKRKWAGRGAALRADR